MIVNKRPVNPVFGTIVGLFSVLLLSLSAHAANYSNQDLIQKSADCLNCHEDRAVSLAGSPHEMKSDRSPKSTVGVGCIGCHDGWEKHLENPSAETITNPSGLTVEQQAELCRRCHVTRHQTDMASFDPHSRAGLGCNSCHSIHNNQNQHLVKDKSQNFCATCHTTVAAEFKRRSVHPLESGNISCTDCHKTYNLKDPDLAVGLDWTCRNCHPEKSGPFIHEHPVVDKFRTDGRGCTECHEPHGSANDFLLTQPDKGTCLQCHGIPPRHLTEHNGLGNRFACAFCHSDIHGSNTNEDFLDPDIGTKLFPNCLQSGCHGQELDE